MEMLLSEFYPDQTPQQLYKLHLEGVKKLLVDNPDWRVQKVNSKRYMAALSDHLRWFLEVKKIPSYQAEFATWH